MSTLTQPVVADLLSRLFVEAEASQKAYRAQMDAKYTPEERRARFLSATGYREYYGAAKDAYLAVSRDTARLLYLLARSNRARTIIEFGTSFGISTLHLAAALRDNGGGELIGTEFEPTKVAKARENLTYAGLADLVEIREGDALTTLASGLPSSIDLVLLDGAKALYGPVLALLEPCFRPGTVLVADNADASPEYLAKVRSPHGGYISVPFADDVEVSMRA
jgi:predicted O-methyltransferase YrrM